MLSTIGVGDTLKPQPLFLWGGEVLGMHLTVAIGGYGDCDASHSVCAAFMHKDKAGITGVHILP